MRCPPIVTTLVALAVVLLLPATAGAQADALQRCRALADTAARLACYDAIPLSAAASPAPAVAARPAAAPVPAPAAPPAAAPPMAAAPPADRAATFGLPDKTRTSEPEAIEAQVGKDFTGWSPNERIRLDNGQVWQVTDGSTGDVRPGSHKVKVRRAALGSYVMEFEGLNRSPRVRRVE